MVNYDEMAEGEHIFARRPLTCGLFPQGMIVDALVVLLGDDFFCFVSVLTFQHERGVSHLTMRDQCLQFASVSP